MGTIGDAAREGPSGLLALRFAQAQDTGRAPTAGAAAWTALGRVDAVTSGAPGRDAWACRRGCAHCCHLLVQVTPGEADLVAAHARETLAPSRLEALARAVRRNADRGTGLDAGAWRRARLRCAFLDEDDACSIYAVRPIRCRVHASRSAEACAATTGAVPVDAWLAKAGSAIHAGLGAEPDLELHQAVAHRLG